MARLRDERDTAQQQARAEREARTQLDDECAAHTRRIRQLEDGIEQGADHIASLELQVQTMQDDMMHRGAHHQHAADPVAEIARQVHSGAAEVGDVVLVQWTGRHWVVVNSPPDPRDQGGGPTRLSEGIVDQLDLDKDRLHLVRVVFRDDSGALVVEGI